MADNVRAVSTARVSALEGIRSAISQIVKSAQQVLESHGVEIQPVDEVTLSPEARGKLPGGAQLTRALREMEMSRYRAAASVQVARAADEQTALVVGQFKSPS